MIREQFIQRYWQYYLALEEDFIKTIRYVAINVSNYSTFSNEFIRQLLSIGSEVDVLLKGFSPILDSSKSPGNIKGYADILLNSDLTKHVIDVKCKVKKIPEIELQPWKDWIITDNSYNSPRWWVSYNQVKHNRITNYSEGNLENVINSLAGLYIIEMFCCKVLCNNSEVLTVPTPISELFEIENWENQNIIVGENLIISVCE